MKRFIGILAIMATMTLFLSSCAQRETIYLDDSADQSFHDWMAEKYPEIEITDYGVYVDKLVTADSGIYPAEGEWVSINYTGRLINNGVYATRYEDVAIEIGIFEYTTHFVPQLCYMDESLMPEGMYDALLTMQEGETYRLYIPPTLAYYDLTALFSTGYAGTSTIYTYAPIIVDLELVAVVEDASQTEELEVMYYAEDNWGIIAADTLFHNFYLDKIDSVDGSKVIAEDSVAYIYYKGSFLDGFVFDTNVDTVALNANIYDISSASYYAPIQYAPSEYDEDNSESTDDMIKAFSKVFLNTDDPIYYNDRFRIVFTSDYSYEDAGSSSGSTVIQGYEPLIFEIWVEPYIGTNNNPYDVDYILETLDYTNDADPKTDTYLAGYIVGCVEGSVLTDNTAQFEEHFTSSTNLLLASTSTETDITKCIPIDISTYPELQQYYNLLENAWMLGTYIAVYGDITDDFLGVTGFTNIRNSTSYSD